MKTMKMPGFTAEESSLSKLSSHFQARTEADVNGGFVRPAQNLYNPRPRIFCLSKLECRPLNTFPWLHCSYTGFGFWNPVTNRCE